MEVQTDKALSPMQNFRYELLQWCGNVEDAKKANSFVMGSENPGKRSYQSPSGNTERHRCHRRTCQMVFISFKPMGRLCYMWMI